MPAKKSTVGAIPPQTLRKIGIATNGSYWQVDVALACDTSKSQMTRLLNGERTPDYAFSQKLKGFMIQRLANIAPEFSCAPLPQHERQRTVQAQKLIAKAVALLKMGETIMPVWKPVIPRARGNTDSAQGVIPPETLRRIGIITNGRYWQVDVALACDTSKSQMTRFLNGERTPDYDFSRKLKGFMIQRLADIASKFGYAPLPQHDSEETIQAQKLIARAVALLKMGETIMPVWKPVIPEARGGRKLGSSNTKIKAKK